MKRAILITMASFCISSLCSQNEGFNVRFQYCFEDFMKLNFAYKSKNALLHQSCNTETIKVDITNKNFSSYAFFACSIYESLIKGKLKGYDIESGALYSREEIENHYSVIDTVTTYHPQTYAETISFVRALHLSDFNCYKVDQKWVIKNNQIDIEVIELNPVKRERAVESDLLKIPIENAKTLESIINSPEIDWIKTTEESVPVSAFSASGLQKLKKIIWDKPKNNLIPIYEYDQNIYVENKRIDNKKFYTEIAKTTVDTVTTYNPETYAETINLITNNGIDFDDIVGFRIQQAWYFNSEEPSLGCILLGICPLIETRGTQDDIRLMPLYMMVNKELK